MLEIDSVFVKTEITFVKIINDLIISGVGGNLKLFDKSSRMLQNINVFEGQKIYGVVFNSRFNECMVYGANKMKLFSCDLSLATFEMVCYCAFGDWILAAKWLNADEHMCILSMKNGLSLWSKDFQLLKSLNYSEKSLLYSACIIGDKWENLVVLSGTVFSEVLAWNVNDTASILCRLEGHKGVIFSIDYNHTLGLICTTSDDRSAKLWSLTNDATFSNSNLLPYTRMSLKCSLYGHNARVFRCMVLDQYVITAGEDSLINIWNLDGTLLKKIDAHQGAPIWALDYDKQNNIIASGGGDCSLNLFPLKENIVKHKLQIPKGRISRRLAVLNDGDLVIITEQGVLFHYCCAKATWNEVAFHNDMKSYALLEASNCKKRVALAGYRGVIIIYQKMADTLKLIGIYEIENKSRIFSLHWLSSSTFLTCATKGNLALWRLHKSHLIRLNQFKLPITKERWTTAAICINQKYIVVGDRKGNIYLYSELGVDPIQRILKAHNHFGVTSLHFRQNILTTLGRNSLIKKFNFDTNSEKLNMFSCDKVPWTWLAAMCEDGSNEFLVAFLGTEVILWDYKRRRTLLQLNCGGGHRSWNIHFSGGYFNFAYIKNNIINTVQVELASVLPLNLIEEHHISKINSGIYLPYNNTCKGIFISGGEDTTLRINVIKVIDNTIHFPSVKVLKVHLSSIRAITAYKFYENRSTQKYLLFTGGGRAQIIVWELRLASANGIDVDVLCRESHSLYEHDENVPEVRVMDLCTITSVSFVVLVSVCSDGTIKVYLVTKQDSNYKLNLIQNIVYKLKCILKVLHVPTCENNLLVTVATDGKITFWDFTSLINNLHTLTTGIEMTPLACFDTHQSGINSISYKQINETCFIFVTGGDDNAIMVSLFKFVVDSEGPKIERLSTYCNVSSHCAQITGAFILEDYFVTTSIDQKLNIFNYKLENNVVSCSFLNKIDSVIPDIQGLEYTECVGCVFVFLYGKGLEICRIYGWKNVK